MTRQEAIQIIKERFYPSHVGLVTNETMENAKALRMAIKALSEPINCVECKHYYEIEDDSDIVSHLKNNYNKWNRKEVNK